MFLSVCSASLLKTLWEKEKLATSPFPTVFSTRLENFLLFSSRFKLLSANSFILEASEIGRLGKGYNLKVLGWVNFGYKCYVDNISDIEVGQLCKAR